MEPVLVARRVGVDARRDPEAVPGVSEQVVAACGGVGVAVADLVGWGERGRGEGLDVADELAREEPQPQNEVDEGRGRGRERPVAGGLGGDRHQLEGLGEVVREQQPDVVPEVVEHRPRRERRDPAVDREVRPEQVAVRSGGALLEGVAESRPLRGSRDLPSERREAGGEGADRVRAADEVQGAEPAGERRKQGGGRPPASPGASTRRTRGGAVTCREWSGARCGGGSAWPAASDRRGVGAAFAAGGFRPRVAAGASAAAGVARLRPRVDRSATGAGGLRLGRCLRRRDLDGHRRPRSANPWRTSAPR